MTKVVVVIPWGFLRSREWLQPERAWPRPAVATGPHCRPKTRASVITFQSFTELPCPSTRT